MYAYWITVNYREAYGIYACNGILFNHESPLRGETFVTRKITRGVAEISLGLQKKLWLGNLHAKRDWGHAKDFVEAMWRILQQPIPEDFVIATGITNSVRDFAIMAFARAGMEIIFEGDGINEKGIVVNNETGNGLKKGDIVVEVDERYFRLSEVDLLIGDATKAKQKLGWEPTYTLQQIINEMVDADLKYFRGQLLLKHTVKGN